MFEDIRNITISGGFFDQPTTLELLENNQPLSIIYGRNGSGKTTIAKAIRQLVGKDTEQPTDEGYVLYSVSTDATILDEIKKSVFIFDEEFVRENVRMKGNGLETIVMMGKQVDLDTQIANKGKEINEIEQKITEQIATKEKFENKDDTSSPLYFFNAIREKLREDGGWADIDRDIKGNSVKSRVSEDLVKRLIAIAEPEETEDVLREQLMADSTLYSQTEEAQAIIWKTPELKLPLNLTGIKSLLEKIVDRPTLSEREQRLLTFLQSHVEHHSQDSTRQMMEEKWPFCPLCLRETDGKDYEYIGDTLKHILNKATEVYTKALDEALESFVNIEIAMPELPEKLNDKERTTVVLAIDQLNKDVSFVRNLIIQRKRDIYGTMQEAFSAEVETQYCTHLRNYMTSIKELEACVERYNKSVNEREKLKKKIFQINDALARKHLSALFEGYIKANKSYEECKAELSKLLQAKDHLEGEIKTLRSQIERTDIALDFINNELQYVFYSDKKVKLTAGEGCYKLKINGRNVPPKKISVGERNVLGLCYFFAKVFSDKKKEDTYKDEILIVIDDPVSSFDYGNRLGVMSLLRYQFCSIKNGNANSRMIVLTHDLRSAFDLVKVRSELYGGNTKSKKFKELVDKHMVDRKVSNEYKKLLEFVYDYAKNQPESDDGVEEGIGNAMRRVVEAFSSFCYNMSFEEMMCRDGILKSVPDDKKRRYYENFMCRLALNGESHMEEQVYNLDTITPYFTKQEKVQTAKSLLLLLNYINPEHLSCYFAKKNAGDEDKMAEIENWKSEEASWI